VAREVDGGQPVLGCKLDDQVAMNDRQPACCNDQTAVTADSISAALRRLTGLTSTLSDGATAWITPNWPVPEGVAGSRRIAIRVTSGPICLSSSSHFPPMAYSNEVKPVAFPPGGARLSMKPAPTGSATIANTIGTVRVTCSSGPRVEAPGAKTTSGARAANSAACLRTASELSVAQRMSIRTLCRCSSLILPAPAETPPPRLDIPHRPRLREGARRCAACARVVAPEPPAAMQQSRRRAA